MQASPVSADPTRRKAKLPIHSGDGILTDEANYTDRVAAWRDMISIQHSQVLAPPQKKAAITAHVWVAAGEVWAASMHIILLASSAAEATWFWRPTIVDRSTCT